MRRRALLSALAAASTAGLAGCFGNTAPAKPARSDESRNDSSPPEPSSRSAWTQSTPGSRPVRCRGEPVSVERSVSDEPGHGDDIEYFPANGTVRFVATRNADGPASFGEWTFEEWGSIECAEAALERARGATAERLGTDEFGSGMGRPPGFFSGSSMVVRLDVATRVEDGEAVRTQTVSLSRLADVAPRSVEAAVSIGGDEFSRTVPVFAEHAEVGLA